MTSTWHHDTLSIDQQVALRTAAGHLARQFDGTFGRQTIERFLHSSDDELADRAQPWPSAASTSPPSIRSRGPTRSCEPPAS